MSAVQSVGPQALPALQEQVEQIIAEARRQGASACEVAVSLEQGLSTSVRQREVETVEFNRDQGFGITLYVGQRKGSASTSATGWVRRAMCTTALVTLGWGIKQPGDTSKSISGSVYHWVYTLKAP